MFWTKWPHNNNKVMRYLTKYLTIRFYTQIYLAKSHLPTRLQFLSSSFKGFGLFMHINKIFNWTTWFYLLSKPIFPINPLNYAIVPQLEFMNHNLFNIKNPPDGTHACHLNHTLHHFQPWSYLPYAFNYFKAFFIP